MTHINTHGTWLAFTCQSLCGWEMLYPMQRIVVNCTFLLEWLRTLGKLSFTAALIISVSSGNAFTLVYQKTSECQAIPILLLYHPSMAKSHFIGCTVRGAYCGESFWSSCLLICALFCQQGVCAWTFFVQVYIEEYETAMGFGFFFFQFYQQSGWKVQFLC